MEEEEKKEEKQSLDIRLLEETEKSIETLLDEGITTENVKTLSELVDIHKDIIHERKEIKDMNYRNYGNYDGRGPSRGAYGENYGNYGDSSYGAYGRRGVDSRYRGYGHLDRMYDDYGRYEENRNRYGANEDTKKSLEYMLKSMEDFARMLKEEASSQEEVQMVRETAQRIAQM